MDGRGGLGGKDVNYCVIRFVQKAKLPVATKVTWKDSLKSIPQDSKSALSCQIKLSDRKTPIDEQYNLIASGSDFAIGRNRDFSLGDCLSVCIAFYPRNKRAIKT